MGRAPEVSVVVLTYNRLESLKNCIDHIDRNSRYVKEIIVVDNGSQDGTRDWLAQNIGKVEPIMRVDNSEGVCARNYGFQEALYDYVCQVDDDVFVRPNWDSIMLKHFEDKHIKEPFKVGAVGLQGFKLKPSWMDSWPCQEKVAPGDFCDILSGFCWMWIREEEVGGEQDIGVLWEYDWSFAPFWHEESELQMRMRAIGGYKFKATPEVCTHVCQRTKPVDWKLHNRNLDAIRNRWRGKEDMLHLEGYAPDGQINFTLPKGKIKSG